MTNQDHELGHLSASIEEMEKRIDRIYAGITQRMKEDHDETRARIMCIEQRLKSIDQHLSFTYFLWQVVKALIFTVLAVLAFKLGDVKQLWAWFKL